MINGQLDNNIISLYTLIENNFDLGLKDYPIFDESYRPILNKAIIDTYLFHEIGWHNPNVFKHFLNVRMDLLMRNKYNALYEAKAIEFNPLYNVEMHETFSRKVDNKNNVENNSQLSANDNSNINSSSNTISDNTSTNTASALSLHSNYPSEDMNNNQFENNVYVDSGQRQTNNSTGNDKVDETTTIESDTTNTSSSIGKNTVANNGEQTETYSRDTVGSSAGLPFSRAMMQLKDYLDEFQLDQQIISELSDLFYNLY